MDMQRLATRAFNVIESVPRDLRRMNGIKVAPGFFNVWNEQTGQCRTVLYHPNTDTIIKRCHDTTPPHASGRYLDMVEMLDNLYRIRLPKLQVFEARPGRYVQIQEYIRGTTCGCADSWCMHSEEVSRVSGCLDAHNGNWLISGDEIILFDFEGTPL